MITTRLYLDTRSVEKGEPAPLKISITKNGVASYISTGVRIPSSQWDRERGKVVDNPNKVAINSFLQTQKLKIDNLIMTMTMNGELTKLSSVQIKNIVAEKLSSRGNNVSFMERYRRFTATRGKQRTREIYQATEVQMLRFDAKVKSFPFERVNKEWLTAFDQYLIGNGISQNTRSIHFRNIRAVFNDAIDDGVTEYYPFRKFMVNPTQTAKRAYTAEKLREVFDYPVLPHERKYLDMFKLIFLLVGINVADLYNLRTIEDGRINYRRSKTSKLYSIKVEPEALEIIERYRGSDKLLNTMDNYKSSHTYESRLNNTLKQIGPRTHKNGQLVYHPAFPDISTYVARHSWATIANEIGIRRETISAALGHPYGNKTTAIYINENQGDIDEANRRVIDYVLGNKD